MFSKSSKTPKDASRASGPAVPKMAAAAKSATFSVIGSDVVITGDIRASVDLHIDGSVGGDIACAALIQGEGSHIKGQVDAQSARLAGHVEGSVHVGELIVEATARIQGDVSYDRISVAPGAQVDGRFVHRGGASAPNVADLKLVAGEAEAN